MNLSRIYTLRAREAGYSNVVSVGRVQTPTMALVMRREVEILQFEAVDFFTPQVLFQHDNGNFLAKWKTREIDGVDAEGCPLRKEVAEKILSSIKGEPAKIGAVEQKKGKSPQRLPYSLSALQIEAGRIYGYSPQEVLDTQQSLYEKKLTSYPRSDCDYLPENQLLEKDTILQNLAGLGEDFSNFAQQADRGIKSRAWNDKKISAHHAIIPTIVKADFGSFNEKEKKMYALVAKAYIAQFYPEQEFLMTKIEVSAGSEIFVANGKVILSEGWKSIYKNLPAEEKDGEEEAHQNLPAVCQGEPLHFLEGKIAEGRTKPPARFTPATLLKAMKEIHKYVKDKELKASLKECSGIGTEVTRASIIEGLEQRGFIRIEKKNFVPGDLGIALCKILPSAIVYPDITAR